MQYCILHVKRLLYLYVKLRLVPVPYLTPLAQYIVLFPSNIQTLGHKAVLSLNDAMPLNF